MFLFCSNRRIINVSMMMMMIGACLMCLSVGTIFTALHGMQTQSSDENSVLPSVRPSVTRVDCDKILVERSVQFLYLIANRACNTT